MNNNFAKTIFYITLFSLNVSLNAVHPFWQGLAAFTKAAIQGHLGTIGTVLPCSESTGALLCNHITTPTDGKKLRVVEAGAGTGTMTAAIIRHLESLGCDYELIAVEYLPGLFTTLQEKFSNNPRVTLICGDINAYRPSEPVDHIVSSIPFESFKPADVQQFLRHYQVITKKEGTISYVTYGKLNRLKGNVLRALCASNKYRAHADRQEILGKFRTKGNATHVVNQDNWPTIDIYHVRNTRQFKATHTKALA